MKNNVLIVLVILIVIGCRDNDMRPPVVKWLDSVIYRIYDLENEGFSKISEEAVIAALEGEKIYRVASRDLPEMHADVDVQELPGYIPEYVADQSGDKFPVKSYPESQLRDYFNNLGMVKDDQIETYKGDGSWIDWFETSDFRDVEFLIITPATVVRQGRDGPSPMYAAGIKDGYLFCEFHSYGWYEEQVRSGVLRDNKE